MLVPGSANPLLLRSAAAAGYSISRSLRFNSSDSAYLSRTPASAGNRRTWTWAGWVKFSTKDTGTNQSIISAGTTNSDTGFQIIDYVSNQLRFSGAATVFLQTTAVYRDPSAWMHIVVAFDATQSTSASKLKFYVNGSEITTFTTDNRASISNQDYAFNNTVLHELGRNAFNSARYFDGYLADIYFIDGQALTPSSFTETDATTGQLIPKAYTGSYGTNGFHLDFADNSSNTATTLGKDTSGNGNNWTPNNLSVADGVTTGTGALSIYNTSGPTGATKGTGTRTDSNSSSIVLAVPMEGANNGTTFAEESATIKGSGSAKTITRYNAVTSTTKSRFYGSSGYFDGAGDYLTVDLSSDLGSTQIYTIEFWVNFTNAFPSAAYSAMYSLAYSGGAEILYINAGAYGETVGAVSFNFTVAQTPALNNGAWRHIAIVYDGTNRKIYTDGTLQNTTAFTTTRSYTTLYIGERSDSPGNTYQGYMQDFRIYKGVAKYTSNFTLPSYSPSTAAGNDSLVDVPVNGAQTDTGVGGEVRGNYCTLNPLDRSSNITLTNGNLDFSNTTAGNVRSTFAVKGVKIYCETSANTAGNWGIGIGKASSSLAGNFAAGISGVYGWNWGGGIANFHSNGSYPWNVSAAASDVFQLAIDASNPASVKLFLGRQNTWYDSSGGTTANPATGANPTATLTDNVDWFVFTGGANATNSVSVNFGQRPFAYTAPSGFKALCTANLPAPLVTKPNTVFDTKLYTGNGSSQSISTDFSPDFIWVKERGVSQEHRLYDIIRNTTKLSSNDTAAENTLAGQITGWNASSFTVGAGSNGSVAALNESGRSYVAWAWDAGSSTVTNTQGSITSSVRANATAGFSIVTYTGNGNSASTVGHGLGVAPPLVIAKSRSTSDSWVVYTNIIDGSNDYLLLNSTAAKVNSSHSSPTSTVFNPSLTMGPSVTCVAYCFAPVVGYSSFGSYTGNGSTDGPFVYTGFRPRWIMVKRTDSTASWQVFDAARNTYNALTSVLFPDTTDAEASNSVYAFDFISNGFKVRSSQTQFNASGGTYIYAAFAESPFNYARAR